MTYLELAKRIAYELNNTDKIDETNYKIETPVIDLNDYTGIEICGNCHFTYTKYEDALMDFIEKLCDQCDQIDDKITLRLARLNVYCIYTKR